MKLRVIVFLSLMIVVLGATQLLAHEYYRIVGTIVKFQKPNLEVKTKQGKTYTIGLDKVSVIRIDTKKVDVVELKAGRSVVVDATGDSEKELLADLIRIVPTTSR